MPARRIIPKATAFLAALLALPVAADTVTLDELLARTTPPEGVVFELVGDATALRRMLPRVRDDIARLRRKFPHLPVAVVSHGSEQFALTKERASSEGKVHRITRSLVQDQGVALHVCGTYAGWHGVTPEDFPDYVDVAPSGPAQINLYKELGYAHVEVE